MDADAKWNEAAFLCRRLPSLLYRGFPNPLGCTASWRIRSLDGRPGILPLLGERAGVRADVFSARRH
jgi:hypothetical protein